MPMALCAALRSQAVVEGGGTISNLAGELCRLRSAPGDEDACAAALLAQRLNVCSNHRQAALVTALGRTGASLNPLQQTLSALLHVCERRVRRIPPSEDAEPCPLDVPQQLGQC